MELDLLVISGGRRYGFEIKRTDAPRVTTSMQTAFEALRLNRLDLVHAGTRTYELAKGMRLYETPGHTIGHYSLLLEGSRPMLFASDVVYTPEAYEKGIQAGFHIDPVAGVRSIRRVKELAEEHGAEVFFSHDMASWEGYKHAPDCYEL